METALRAVRHVKHLPRIYNLFSKCYNLFLPAKLHKLAHPKRKASKNHHGFRVVLRVPRTSLYHRTFAWHLANDGLGDRLQLDA
jgi:hypothetical protein